MPRFPIALILILPLLAFIVGCGSGRVAPDRFQVTGTVTLDGAPLEKGTITFTSPEDQKKGILSSGEIINGKYDIQVTPGKKQVKINARVVTGPVNEMGEEPTKEIIPAKYNSKTTLEAEIPKAAHNADFELKSK
ncbi:MAG: hypothetical protein NXI22_01995 [bacterium]|nr:hypothetical protein [bacterium]